MLTDYDPTHTEIYTDCYFTIDPYDICRCNKEYYWDSFYDKCDCPTNRRVTWYGIMVRVPQKPIKTAPKDSMYNIRVFEKDIRESDLDVVELFCEENMQHEFSIIDTISLESDDTYVYLLKKYLFFENDQGMDMKKYSYSYGFSGKASKAEYVKAFLSIAQNMVNNYDTEKKDPENEENAHVDPRMKQKMTKVRKGKKK